MEYDKNPNGILNLKKNVSPCCYSDDAAYVVVSATISDSSLGQMTDAVKISLSEVNNLEVRP